MLDVLESEIKRFGFQHSLLKRRKTFTNKHSMYKPEAVNFLVGGVISTMVLILVCNSGILPIIRLLIPILSQVSFPQPLKPPSTTKIFATRDRISFKIFVRCHSSNLIPTQNGSTNNSSKTYQTTTRLY